MTATVETPVLTALDPAILTGEWINTNADGGIARIVCKPQPDGTMRVACSGTAAEWGEVDAPLYSFTFDSRQAGAFSAVFDLGYEEVRLQANVKAGVLVVASFNRFKDDSGRSN